MTRELFGLIKLYIGSLFDILLFSIAAWDGVDHGLRTVSAIGAIVVLVYLIRKYKQDYRLKQLDEEIKRLELNKLKKRYVHRTKKR